MAKTIKVETYKPEPKQAAMHASDAEVLVGWGAWGSGKTRMFIEEGWALSREFPKNRGLVCGYDFTALREAALEPYKRTIPEVLWTYNGQDHVMTFKDNGSQIIFGDLKNWEKYGSWELGWFHIVEARRTTRQAFDMLMGRLRLPGVMHRAMLDSHPPHQLHWLWKLKKEKASDPNYRFETFRTVDNPHVPPDYLAKLLKLAEGNDMLRRIYIEGEVGFLAEGDPVFKEFSGERHIAKDEIPIMPDREIFKGWDFGFDYPFVSYFQIDQIDRVRVLREFLGNEINTKNFAYKLIDFEHQQFKRLSRWVGCDPAGDSRISSADQTDIQILSSPEFNFQCNWRRTSLVERHHFMRHKLATNQILFNPTGCDTLIESMMGGYCVKKEPRTEDDVLDPNHPYKDAIDSLWYGIANSGLVLIDRPKETAKERELVTSGVVTDRFPAGWRNR